MPTEEKREAHGCNPEIDLKRATNGKQAESMGIAATDVIRIARRIWWAKRTVLGSIALAFNHLLVSDLFAATNFFACKRQEEKEIEMISRGHHVVLKQFPYQPSANTLAVTVSNTFSTQV
jgi:hypothetical protein